MVEVDARDDGDGRDANGRGVEPAAEPDFENRDVHRLVGEVVERERGRRLEHRGVETRHQRAERLHAVDHGVLDDRLAVHADALTERDEVGRGVEPDAVAGGLEDRRQHRGHRTLAVRAADLDEPVAPLGMAQRREQPLDPLEARAHPRVLATAQGEQAGDGLGVRHLTRVVTSRTGAALRRRTQGCGAGVP